MMTHEMNRRRFVACFSSLGLGSMLMPEALAAVAEDATTITPEMIEAAQKIAGLSFTQAQRVALVERLNGDRSPLKGFSEIREAALGNDTATALVFNPVPPGKPLPTGTSAMNPSSVDVSMPSTDEELAFLPLTHLAKLVERRDVTPSELTELYLGRLKHYDPTLHCVVSLTEDIARRQAKRADEEIAAGTYRGPLHGIPWGSKDLLSVKERRRHGGLHLIKTEPSIPTRPSTHD